MTTDATDPFDMDTNHIRMQTTALLLTGDPNGAHPVPTYLAWTRFDPFAVTINFQTGRTSFVEWVFDRELLVAGGGIGDVVVAYEDDGVHLFVSSPSGNAEFLFDTDWINQVLSAFENSEMPIGRERTIEKWTDEEWQEELAVLLAPRKTWT